MKKLLYLLICVLAVTAVACSDDDSWEPVEFGKLPSQAQNFMSIYFGGKKVKSIEKDGKGSGATYEVELTDGTEIEFDAYGEWIEVEGGFGVAIPTGFINPAIMNYVIFNHPTQQINSISREYYGFKVEFVSGGKLYFDSQGNLLRGPY